MKTAFVFFLFISLSIITVACNSVPEPSPEEVSALSHKLKSDIKPEFVEADKASSKRWSALLRLYEKRDFRPLWTANGRTHRRVDDFIQTLNQAPQHGLNRADYNTTPVDDPLEYELRLTWALVDFGFDVAGNGHPVEQALSQAIEEGTLSSVADKLAPQHPEYQALQTSLLRYRQKMSEPAKRDWADLPVSTKLRILGLTDTPASEETAEALKRFEARHGLPVDGLPDEVVLEELNIPPADRIRQIELNMRRLRQLPSDLGVRHIRVNIPDYELTVVENESPVLTMRVVVGKQETPTPIFSAEMTHIVFSPYWNIPDSILRKETLPKVFEDQDYLARQNIEIVRVADGRREIVHPSDIDWSDASSSEYRFRQKPGVSNALGLVKFLFPNSYDVYLHDTPADNLFVQPERDFSHGCIRVEQPLQLALYLLRDQPQWTKEKIENAMHSGEETTAKLETGIPVHIVYMTAWGAPDGSVNFRRDIYGLDKAGAK